MPALTRSHPTVRFVDRTADARQILASACAKSALSALVCECVCEHGKGNVLIDNKVN